MNLKKTFALTLALGTVFAVTATSARAGSGTNGTFTLPEQAYWNDVLLPAGNYSISVESTISGVSTVCVRGEGVTATFIAPAGAEPYAGRSDLLLDQTNGTYIVREFNAGVMGRSFHFGVSKALRNQMLRGEAQPVRLPVSAATGS